MYVNSDGWTCYTPEEKQKILDSTGEYYDIVVASDDSDAIRRQDELAESQKREAEEKEYSKKCDELRFNVEKENARLREELESSEFKGWQDCLDSVRGSLRGYPNCGGDIEVMREVERITKWFRDALEHESKHSLDPSTVYNSKQALAAKDFKHKPDCICYGCENLRDAIERDAKP